MSDLAIETGDEGGGEAAVDTTLTPTQPSGFDSQLGTLPESLRSDPALQNVKSLEDMANQFVHSQHMIGKKGIMPPADGDLKDMGRFFKELGRPDTPGQYDLGEWAPPEGVPWDESLQGGMLEVMHKVGLNDWQVKEVLGAYSEMQGTSFEELQQSAHNAHTSAAEALKNEWGTTYENRVHMASRAISHVFGEDEAESVLQTRLADGSALGNNVAFIKAMEKVGQMVGEDSLAAADAAHAAKYAYTPDGAQAEIDKLSGDSDFMDAFLDEHHMGHKEATQRWERLHAFAHPSS